MKLYIVATLLFTAGLARSQQVYQDAVLTYSADTLQSCPVAVPAPSLSSAKRSKNSPSATPTDSPQSSCPQSDTFYRLISGGKLYGLKRTTRDAKRDAVTSALTSSASGTTAGALALQPTGTHFRIRSDQTRLYVLQGKSESSYEILYTR